MTAFRLNIDSDDILEFLKSEATRPMKPKEIARALGLTPAQYTPFRKELKKLVEAGHLIRLKKGKIGVPAEMDIIAGKISINRSGTGFIEREGKEDLMILSSDTHTAFDGDQVMVRRNGSRFGRETGTVIRIVKRATRRMVGSFRSERGMKYVHPDNVRIHRDIYINTEDSLNAKNNEKVVVELTAWDDPYLNPQGKIVERLGMVNKPGVDLLTVIRSYNLEDEFPPEVLDQAEVSAGKDVAVEYENREDLTSEIIYTIDPVDAKDFDDAVSLEKLENGYRLGVHIADVSFFVEENSKLDLEALKRGNSVYLPGKVLPMLPEVLSNDVCSLRPNRKRLAHSVFMEFDKQGKMKKSWVTDTVIRSRARLTYEEVQDFFDGREYTSRIERVKDNLILARELALLLNKKRFNDGSLDFDLPEAKIILNDKGEVTELGSKVRLESHRLVEEFMLVANQAVAKYLFRLGLPLLYRVHDKPTFEKLQMFSQLMKRLGYSFPVSKTMRPIQFARFLEEIKDESESDFINELMLRSMQKAVYQRENIGHFGLAFKQYTHFTSPIRRYPDLLIHRLVRKVANNVYPKKFAKKANSIIDHVGEHCSETERIAENAERTAVKMKQVAFMAKHLGDEYSGVISGTTNHGFFVRLDNLGVEGMVRLSSLNDDYYHFDEANYRIIGRRTGMVYRMGDSVRVGLASVDTEKNEIDLFLAIRAKENNMASKKKQKGLKLKKPVKKRYGKRRK